MIIISNTQGTSVDLDEIAIVTWNAARTLCDFYLKGNSMRFRNFEPREDDEVYAPIDDRKYSRTSLEHLRSRFP